VLSPDARSRLVAALPVGEVVPELLGALEDRGVAVLVAPPGTGKTTVVPLVLADALPAGRVVVAEPRRVAVRAAARRMASLLGEDVGGRVGYAVRGERRTSAATRVEVVTTGLLLRRLLRDPELPGVAAVVLDEVHERHLDADLAKALVLDARRLLREDLRVVAASATLDGPRLADLLGDGAPAPVVTATAPLFGLDVRWCPPPRPVRPPEGLRVDPTLLAHVAHLVADALDTLAGDVLVFLPGAGEISAVARRLAGRADVDVHELHGGRSAAAQDAALQLGPRRRVVLATAVAESSLTVPGVRVVVDAGLARVPRTDHARGLAGLDTVRVSRASADQRAGRAAREGAGTVLRAWSAAEHALLVAHPDPEIATGDLTSFALTAACWGPLADLPLLDAPPAGPLAAATDVLRRLGALAADGTVTARGRAIADVGVHPRLARALLDGAARVGADRAAEVVALLSEEVRSGSDDLVATWRRVRGAGDGDTARWRAEVRRLRGALPAATPAGGRGAAARGVPDDVAAGEVVALAHPERLARRRGGEAYTGVGGTGLDLAPGSALLGSPWLAVAVASRAPGQASARVRAAVAVSEELARDVAAADLATTEEVVWRDGDVRARRVERLGALVLAERPLASPSATAVQAALADGVRREGLALLTWTPAAESLRRRVACCRGALGEAWPDLGDEALLAALPAWLGPDLAAARGRRDLARVDVAAALRRLLPWELAGRLAELAPETVEVPTGRRARLDYADPAAPVLALKLQEAFGWRAGPRVAGGRVSVVVHLLSPAGRPLAITADLESFWRTVYPQVRGEVRGRYPRHPWPEDPLAAAPTARLKPRPPR